MRIIIARKISALVSLSAMVKVLSANEINQAARLLRQEELVAFPTETVYGLGARLFSPKAIASIFAVKKRPADNPLIAHICDVEQVALIASDIPPVFYQLAKAFFPGPLALIIKKNDRVPEIASAGLDSIAVRMPGHPLALQLIAETGEPLVAPSANLSGKPSSTCAEHVIDDFAGSIAAVIDGGDTEFGIESTVVSLLSDTPVLMRPGFITKAALEEVLGYSISVADSNARPISPGMKYRHYAPQAAMKVFYALDLLERYLESAEQNSKVLLVSTPIASLSHLPQFDLSAKELYGHLRGCDKREVDEILVFCDERTTQDAALMNRLLRASQLVSSQ